MVEKVILLLFTFSYSSLYFFSFLSSFLLSLCLLLFFFLFFFKKNFEGEDFRGIYISKDMEDFLLFEESK